MFRDPYQAYVDNAVVGSNALQLVVAMYETAIQRTQEARICLETDDIWGRARAITKASNILTELRASLRPEAGEIAGRLGRLYRYMQKRLQEAHIKKSVQPLAEVEKILRNLLEAWQKAEARERAAKAAPAQILDTGRATDKFSPYEKGGLPALPARTMALSA